MALAQSYFAGMENPFANLVGGYQTGLETSRYRNENQLLATQHNNEIAGLQGLQHLDFNDPDHIRQFAAQYPSISKGVTGYLDKLDANEKQATLADMSKSIALLRNNRSDVAVSDARAKAAAYQNSGNAKKAAEYSNMADWIEKDPTSAMNGLTMSYSLAVPKDAGANVKAYNEAYNPEVKTVDTGDAVKGYSVNPQTGAVSSTYNIAGKNATPDAQLQSTTNITTTGMNNDSSQAVANTQANSASNVAGINANSASQVADINGRYGVAKEDLSQQGQNARSQAQLNLDAQKLYFQQQQAEITNRQAEIKEAGGKMWVVYKDGSYKPALDQTGQQMAAMSKGGNTAAQKQQVEGQRIQKLNTTLPEIEKLLTSGDATGSGVGNLVDKGAGMLGISTKGAQTTAQLQSLAGQITALMPRMEGPQSDKDVAMYREMAGNLGNANLPTATRLAALRQIQRLNNKYAALNTQATQTAGTPAATSAPTANVHQFFTGK